MTFNEAKRILRELGYSVRKAADRVPGVTEYNVHRIWRDPATKQMRINRALSPLADATANGDNAVPRWLLTADSIKAGIARAKYLATEQEVG
jgi:hypothetical protein